VLLSCHNVQTRFAKVTVDFGTCAGAIFKRIDQINPFVVYHVIISIATFLLSIFMLIAMVLVLENSIVTIND
jgi:hypothetical protein